MFGFLGFKVLTYERRTQRLGATASGRAISASGESKGAKPGADTTIGLLVGATKPGFSMRKARTLTV